MNSQLKKRKSKCFEVYKTFNNSKQDKCKLKLHYQIGKTPEASYTMLPAHMRANRYSHILMV